MISFFIGGICGVVLMCLLQINRDNKAQRKINRAIEYVKNENLRIVDISKEIPELCEKELLEILGGKE